MTSATNLICSVVAGALAIAAFTKPDQATHESRVATAFAEASSMRFRGGQYVDWLLLTGVDLARTGHYEQGLFSSSYRVEVAGRELFHCTGIFGMVTCSQAKH